MKKSKIFIILLAISLYGKAQSDSLLSSILQDDPESKVFVTNAFKSSRVVNNQSLEMIGKGVLDLRILHRFGLLNSGIKNLFGLDQASFRLGIDYGLTGNTTIGFGRSTFQKELDGLIKWRIIQQSAGFKSSPVSVIWVSGVMINTASVATGEDRKSVSDRTAYYHEIIVGRKFNERFSFQFNPIVIHSNRISVTSLDDQNDVIALGAGLRYKLSKRVAFIADYNYVISGLNRDTHANPLGIGFDIETGGHVFQLHFSNSAGMNEKAFITNTNYKWDKGEINFGFNLSRVFSIKKHSIR